jgi:hypothetical protein
MSPSGWQTITAGTNSASWQSVSLYPLLFLDIAVGEAYEGHLPALVVYSKRMIFT